MQLHDFLAKPIFSLFYPTIRKQMGSPVHPIRRIVMETDRESRCVFDNFLKEILTSDATKVIEYNLHYPKVDFLNYICDWCGIVAHGSPFHNLEVLKPIRISTDLGEFGNRQQIFCSPDAIWAMWFAILDKDKFRKTRNGCVRVGKGARRVKFYHFELPEENIDDPPFTEGTIYLASAEDFPDKRTEPILDFFNAEAEEWGSTRPVTPLAKIRVSPQDFPYMDKVQFCLS